jgi:hypothetical protein
LTTPREKAAPPPPLPVHVTEDGRVLVHVGTRFVVATIDELDLALERLAAEGGSVAYSREDTGDGPGELAREVIGLIAEHGLPMAAPGPGQDELDDAGL